MAPEYEIVLDNRKGGRLGIEIEHTDDATLLIVSITGGLVVAWNSKAAPWLQVREGDHIVEVNRRCRGNSRALAAACGQAGILHCMLRRGSAEDAQVRAFPLAEFVPSIPPALVRALGRLDERSSRYTRSVSPRLGLERTLLPETTLHGRLHSARVEVPSKQEVEAGLRNALESSSSQATRRVNSLKQIHSTLAQLKSHIFCELERLDHRGIVKLLQSALTLVANVVSVLKDLPGLASEPRNILTANVAQVATINSRYYSQLKTRISRARARIGAANESCLQLERHIEDAEMELFDLKKAKAPKLDLPDWQRLEVTGALMLLHCFRNVLLPKRQGLIFTAQTPAQVNTMLFLSSEIPPLDMEKVQAYQRNEAERKKALEAERLQAEAERLKAKLAKTLSTATTRGVAKSVGAKAIVPKAKKVVGNAAAHAKAVHAEKPKADESDEEDSDEDEDEGDEAKKVVGKAAAPVKAVHAEKPKADESDEEDSDEDEDEEDEAKPAVAAKPNPAAKPKADETDEDEDEEWEEEEDEKTPSAPTKPAASKPKAQPKKVESSSSEEEESDE